MLVGFDLDTEPFAASAVDVDGLQFAALDLVQHGLSGNAKCRGGLVEAEPAVGCLGSDPITQGLVDADAPGCAGGDLPAATPRCPARSPPCPDRHRRPTP